MKKFVFIISAGLMLCSCGNKQNHQVSHDYEDEKIVMDDSSSLQKDSIDISPSETIEKKETTSTQTAPKPSSTTRTSRIDRDNMRGFDPASEDDTEDNGMSRYMENNDDEGWD